MIITVSDIEEISQLKNNLFREFEMKDLGGLKYFLGIEVLRSNKGIFISQRKYIIDLLAETGMVDCKPADTPLQVNHGLKFGEGANLEDKERYQRLVGKLIYLSHTRPNIAYVIGGNKPVYASTSRGSYGSCHEDCSILEGDTRKWDHVLKA